MCDFRFGPWADQSMRLQGQRRYACILPDIETEISLLDYCICWQVAQEKAASQNLERLGLPCALAFSTISRPKLISGCCWDV